MGDYNFTTDWFTRHLFIWEPLLALKKPKKILEIGSFEGRSATWMIENATKYHDEVEIHCVDTWEGSPELDGTDFGAVEARFWHNIQEAKTRLPPGKKVNVIAHKGTSLEMLSKLVVEGHLSSFDWVLVDGSHWAVDVLYDVIFAFKLCKVGGLIINDDYNVIGEPDHETSLLFPKIALKAWGTVYRDKVSLIPMTLEDGKKITENDTYQLYLTKVCE
jgi:predicted O-methyltransferase YrrM